jgi:GMP synthase (glutamine-hydrolysing)
MPVLVLRHEPSAHLGNFDPVLDDRKRPFLYHDLGEPLDIEGHTGIIVLGGGMSANDPLPGLADELKLIEDAVRKEIPVLGICLGAQLIAKALGARVYRNPQFEIGWEPVYFTDAARSDAVFSTLPSPATFFHWHDETFDLPAGAEWLAYSDKCRHQAFRVGRSVYGIQFHAEVSTAMAVNWCADSENCGEITRVDPPVDSYAVDTAPLARRILENWLNLF